jgi:dimethylsulfone monooxygenase
MFSSATLRSQPPKTGSQYPYLIVLPPVRGSRPLIAELNLNDIKGVRAPSLDAWSTAAALAAVTRRLELMVAVRPSFHLPALLAKQAANIDHISGGRVSLNVVSSWWAEEARNYGVHFEQHDDRCARIAEWLAIVDGVWKHDNFSFQGKYYKVEGNVLQPKPISSPRPIIYAGGEFEAAKNLIARSCDGYVMHGDHPERLRQKIEDLSGRREKFRIAAHEVRRGGICDSPREPGRGSI